MAVNPRAFVKPAFILAGIHADHEYIRFVITDVVGHIIRYTHITTFIITEVKTIQPEFRITEHPIKLYLKTLTGIGSGYVKMFAVPANTGFGEKATYGFVAM